MTQVLEIPLSAQPQKFDITLNGIEYGLTFKYHPYTGWVMDIADETGSPILQGAPLVTGADLLDQFEYLGIGGNGGMQVQSDFNPNDVPTFDNLGTTSHLYFVIP